MELKKLIQHLQVPKGFIQTLWINPSILLKELIDKEQFLLMSKKIDDWDYFFHEKKHIFINTALPRWKFDTARKKLENAWLIKVKLWEWKKMFFKIINSKLNELFFPKSNSEFRKELFIEYILEDWYIFYPKSLAHKIWINETIFIKSLLSKRKYFEKQWKVKNWYFFNSVSNVKADTDLSKDQQLKVIKNLVSYELIDVQLAKDNTRYFCINDDKLIDYENIDINKLLKIDESKKASELKSWKTSEIESENIANFENPFNKKESEKSSDIESSFQAKSESKIIANTESEISSNLKVKKQEIRKQNIIQEESKKADINKTKLKILDNKTKNNNIQTDNKTNSIKSTECFSFMWNNKGLKPSVDDLANNNLLLSSLENFWLSNINSKKLIQKFSEDKILNNLEHIKKDDNIINKPWFLIKSLEQDYTLKGHQGNFISVKAEKEEKIKQKKSEIKKQEFLENQKKNIEKQKQVFYNNLLKNWISENKEEYDRIFDQEKKKFLRSSSSLKNPDILIKAKVNAYVKSEILGV